MSGSKARTTQDGEVQPSVAQIETAARADIDAYLNPGTAAYRRTSAAMLLAGFATFSLMYCVQPLLPELATVFSVSPAVSSLSLSLTTGLLAVSIFIAGLMSDSLN